MDIKEQLTLENLQAKQLIEKNQWLSMLMDELNSLQARVKKLESGIAQSPEPPTAPVDFGSASG